MANSRRKRQGELGDQDNLSPSHVAMWVCSVPQWEKQYCSTIGSIPWRRFLEMKRHTHLYENVLQWDDSAGEKAFKEAKARFWSKFNGLSSNDAALPDPNAYIDDVDWESRADLDLFHDLETEIMTETDEKQSWVDSVPLTEALLTKRSCPGWGEAAEEGSRKEAEARNCEAVPWVPNYDCGAKGVLKSSLLEGASWGKNSGTRNKKPTGWYDSRYKTSRFPVSYECRANRAASFAHEKHVLRQWAMKS